MRRIWRRSSESPSHRLAALIIVVPLVTIDATFLASNALKIPDGGWFPIVIGGIVFTLLTTWQRGRSILQERLSKETMPPDVFIGSIESHPPVRVPGTAVFLNTMPGRVPHALLHNLKHNKVLHERVVLLTMTTRDIPQVSPLERLQIEELGCDFQQFEAFFGFKEDPDIQALLEECVRRGYLFDMMDTSFFVSRETLIATVAPGMALWRERLFVSMSKNATKASEFFNVPTNRVVELGTQVELSKEKRPDSGASMSGWGMPRKRHRRCGLKPYCSASIRPRMVLIALLSI